MRPYTKSLEILSKQLKIHEECIRRIIEIRKVLQEAYTHNVIHVLDHFTFEVHTQKNDPNDVPIRMRDTSLRRAYERAQMYLRNLYKWNDRSRVRVEAFICVDEKFLMALFPEDAVIIGNVQPGERFKEDDFTIDDRTIKLGKLVWKVDEELPGHYAKDLTKEPATSVVSTCSHD